MLWGLTWLPLKHFRAFGIEGPLVTLVAHGSVGLLAIPLLARNAGAWLGYWRSMALLAVFGGAANLSFATAMARGDVTRVMALFYLLPAWGVLLARAFLGERIDLKRGLSLLFALTGSFFVLGGPRMFVAPPSFIDALAALSGFSLAVQNVVFRKTQAVPISLKVAAAFAGCLVLSLGGTWLASDPVPAVPAGIWLETVGFGLVWILLATVGTLYGVNHLEAGRSSMLIIMELLTAVLSSALVTRELPDPSACFGGALIVACAALEALRREPVDPPLAPL
jgi:drug/metabolite transporter (DMT)-like permease